jgi:predicted alpha/beta superfamily hydrolase
LSRVRGSYFMGPPARRRRRGRNGPVLLVVALVVAGAAVGVVIAATRHHHTNPRGADVESFQIKSRLVGRTLEQKAALPLGGARGRPLLVLLHGRGAKPGDAFSDPFFAELDRLGPRAPVVVEANGGDHSYYHDRADGRWGSYVVREVIPAAVKRYRLDPKRVAIGGTSMGGFGALDIARRNPRRFCAVGGHSAAISRKASETAPGAFDDAADFRRHNVYAYATRNPSAYARENLFMDVGRSDPFRSVDTEVARTLKRRHRADIEFHLRPGGHGGDYFQANVASYLRFYARALERC